MSTQQELPANGALLDKRGTALYLNIGERTVDDWMRKRRLPYLKIGKVVRFRRADLDKALERFRID